MDIGKQTLSKMLPVLKEISYQHGLNLNRVRDFRIARWILTHRFITEA
jgi:hypothetical protein